MTTSTPIRQPATAALADAAAAAGHAPSVHNTQPWRWRLEGDRLELLAERGRQLRVADPDGRLLTLSCGAALHHARLALAATGWQARVAAFPDPDDPDLLARLHDVVPASVPAGTDRLREAMRVRHTDRRPVGATPVSPAALGRVREAVAAEGARLHPLRRDQVLALAVAAARAQAAEVADPEAQAELAYWAGGARPDGTGIPEDLLPLHLPRTTVPLRDFGRAGRLPVSAAHDRAATYAILYGDEDAPHWWLRAGQALSAGWLVATDLDLSVLPLSGAVEVAFTRLTLRRLLSGVGEPYLVLRIGTAEGRWPVHTPRLPANQTIDWIDGLG